MSFAAFVGNSQSKRDSNESSFAAFCCFKPLLRNSSNASATDCSCGIPGLFCLSYQHSRNLKVSTLKREDKINSRSWQTKASNNNLHIDEKEARLPGPTYITETALQSDKTCVELVVSLKMSPQEERGLALLPFGLLVVTIR